MNYREPTMLGPKAKEAYKELVRYYKYINDTTRVEDFLETLFVKTLEELKLKEHSVCAAYKSGSRITLDQAQAIKLLDQKYGFNNWTDIVKTKFKIPLREFNQIIQQSFKVTGRDAITKHKNHLLEILSLKQERFSNNHYIVHKTFKNPDEKLRKYYEEKETLQNRYNLIIDIIKKEKGLSPEDLQSYIAGDQQLKEMVNKSNFIFYDEIRHLIRHRDSVSPDDRRTTAFQIAAELKR